MYSCEFVTSGYQPCGAPARRAVSIRWGGVGDWDGWAVCDRHELAITADLEHLGVVTIGYDVDDGEQRALAERLAS